MKNFYKLVGILVFISSINNAQAQLKNEKCGFNLVMDYYGTINSNFKTQANSDYINSIKNSKNSHRAADEVYEIPVVVHVVYSTEEQNLPDSVIHNQIKILNADYMRLNADTVNLRDTFLTVIGNPRIKFRLAGFDPDGNITNGITRTETTELFGEGGGFFGPDIAEIEDVKISAKGGKDPWDQTKYLNIWICDMSAGGDVSLLGYATPPANLPNWDAGSTDGMSDGVVIQYHCFGNNNPNPLIVQGDSIDVIGRTVTHEVGHYLGLRHTAEQAFFTSSCADDDGLKDTPNMAQSQFDCNTIRNSCVDTVINLSGDTLGNLPDMVENYMDYSSELCQNSFTFGQVGVIRDVMQNFRNGLIDNGKLSGVENETLDKMHVSIYPNPSNGVINIHSNSVVNSVELYNELGQRVYTLSTMESNTFKIDLTLQPLGIYFLKINNADNFKVEKIFLK